MLDKDELKELNKKLRALDKKLQNSAKKVKSDVVQTLVISANKMRNSIITSMQRGSKTGREYKRGSIMHRASAPGEAPAVDSGALLAAIFYDVRESALEVELGNIVGAAPYGMFLEKGTKYIEPRPWLAPAVEEHQDELFKQLRHVAIEGITRPFEEL